MHRTELIHLKHPTILTHSIEFHKDAIQTTHRDFWSELTLCHYIMQLTFLALVDNLKTTIAQPSQHLCLAQHAVLALHDIKVQTRGHKQLGQHTLVAEERHIVQPTYHRGETLQNIAFGDRLRFVAAYPYTIVRQLIVDRNKQFIHATNMVKRHEVDQRIKTVVRQLLDVVEVSGTQRKSVGTIQVNILLHIAQHLLWGKLQNTLLQCAFVGIRDIFRCFENGLRFAFGSHERYIILIQRITISMLQHQEHQRCRQHRKPYGQ